MPERVLSPHLFAPPAGLRAWQSFPRSAVENPKRLLGTYGLSSNEDETFFAKSPLIFLCCELTGIDYSDGTPDLWFQLDRLGRTISRNDASGTHHFSYHPDGRIIEQTISSGSLAGLKLIPEHDELNRRIGYRAIWNDREISRHDTEYDGASRIAAVSNGQLRTSYSYLPQSSLISEVTTRHGNKPLLNVRKTWDNLGRLTEIQNQATRANTKSGYQYNSLNQRTERTLEDNTRWEFGYDSLGQVASSSKLLPDGRPLRGYDFDYTFDEIGNRLTTGKNGQDATYSPNSLNQYTERTVPGSVDIVGSARPEATVTVNQQPTHRQGEYFHRQLPVENSGAAAVEQVGVKAVLKRAGTGGNDLLQTKTGDLLIPGTPEAFEYDLDGNLTRNGLWELTWDGENRLVQMISRPYVPESVRKKLVFSYDGQSRRVRKQVYSWNASEGNYEATASLDLRYIYDGWNLLAEIDSLGKVVRSFFWGLDLSGSMQGDGGVGGLLALTKGNQSWCYTYDGNGNVTGLVDRDGQSVAKYQYGPFGELLESTGEMESENPYRFSTKYEDPESGWYYYGFRLYEPSTGRWLNRDPIGELAGDNLMAFVLNRPIANFDVLGQFLGDEGDDNLPGFPEPPKPKPPFPPGMGQNFFVGPEQGSYLNEEWFWTTDNPGWLKFQLYQISQAIEKQVDCHYRKQIIPTTYVTASAAWLGTFVVGHVTFEALPVKIQWSVPVQGGCCFEYHATVLMNDRLGLDRESSDAETFVHDYLAGAFWAPTRTVVRARFTINGSGCCSNGKVISTSPMPHQIKFE